MSDRRQIQSNAISGAIQAIIAGAALFLIYRTVFTHEGASGVGIWAVVASIGAIGRIADAGINAALTRELAAIGHDSKRARLISATLVFVASAIALLLIAGYGGGRILLGHIFGGHILKQALELLPWILVATWTQCLSGVFAATLDGFNRIDQRNIWFSGAIVAQSIAILVLMPMFGLVAIGYSLAGVGLLQAVAGAWLVHRQVALRIRDFRFRSLHALKPLYKVGLGLQGAAVLSFFFDPLARILIAQAAGPAIAGYFDTAGRIVHQARQVVHQFVHGIVPSMVRSTAQLQRDQGMRWFQVTQDWTLWLGSGVTAGMVTLAPSFSFVLLGTVHPPFVAIFAFVAVAWLLNHVALASYFRLYAEGRTRTIMTSHLVMVLSLVAGFMARPDAAGLLGAYFIGLWAGSIVLLFAGGTRQATSGMKFIGLTGTGSWLLPLGVFATTPTTSWTVLSIGMAVVVGIGFIWSAPRMWATWIAANPTDSNARGGEN